MTNNGTDHRSTLLAYATAVASTDDAETVYEEMAATADVVLDAASVVVETENDGVLSVRAWSGRPPNVDGIAADEGIAGHTFQTGEPLRVDNVHEHDLVETPPADAPSSVLSVPIGETGVFQAGVDDPNGFSEADVEIAELLASHAHHAIKRIRSQCDLEDSERRFRALFEETDDALVLYDIEFGHPGPVQHANDAAMHLFDATEASLRKHTLPELLAADDDQFLPETDTTFQTTLAANDGRVLDVTVKSFSDGGGPDAFATITDVTEQHYRERSLTDLHDATRRMLVVDTPEEISNVIVDAAQELLDLPYVGVFFVTESGTELRPAALSDPLGDGESLVFERGSSLAWDALEAGEPQLFEDVANHPHVHNEDTIIQEEIVHPLGDHGVVLVGADEPNTLTRTDQELVSVLATNGEAALDRAERVRMLRERETELRRERNRLAALFENIPSPTASFVVEDGEPVVQSVNPGFERVFGYSEETLVGENIDDYIVPSEHSTEADVYNEKLMAGQSVNAEVRRLTANGSRDFLLDVVPFRLDEPNVHGYAMYTDITERKERERELERQNDRLEEFASIVSHDLRNPLNVARGYVELAEESGSDEHFDRADTALERMHDIIESVLTLARQGRSLDETVEISLERASDRAWQNVDTAAAELDVPVDVTVDADPSRLGSLLENLFRNAVEHGSTSLRSQTHEDAVEHGDEDVTVTVGALSSEDGGHTDDDHNGGDDHNTGDDGHDDRDDQDGRGVRGFYVADDGSGIPVERREDVFRSGETHSEDGTGFGLAIVKSIADAHGWTVDLTESEAGGARFEFYVGENVS